MESKSLRLLQRVLSSTLSSGPFGPMTYLGTNHPKACRNPWCNYKNKITFESNINGGGEPLYCWEQMFRGDSIEMLRELPEAPADPKPSPGDADGEWRR
jgi:hypothetical protein